MKYIDAEKLKSEIERLSGKYPSWQVKSAMDDLSDFIDSLQQEPPEVDLEAEVRIYCRSSFKFDYDELNDSFNSNALGFDDIVELARHFYELGKNSK